MACEHWICDDHIKCLLTFIAIRPGSPPLRKPIALKEDGTPEPPKQEKSFLAKYWMYLLPVVLLLVLPSESSAGGSAEHDSSSERAPNPAQQARRVK